MPASALDPDTHPPVVAIDTVGFTSDPPPPLIASFRSTLEELEQADLLVHVVDASAAQAREQLEVTEKVMKELKGDGKPRVTVLNKIDQLENRAAVNRSKAVAPGAVAISSFNRED